MEHISTAASTAVTTATGTPRTPGSSTQSTSRDSGQKKLPERVRVMRMRELPSTENLRTQRATLLEAWQNRTSPGSTQEREVKQRLAQVDAQLQEAQVRDEIHASRPENCFCLGTGTIPYRLRWHVEVKPSPFCWCPDGQMAAQTSEADRQSYEHEMLEQRRTTIVADIGIPEHFRGFSLATFQPEPAQGPVLQQMRRWAQGEGGSVFLHGEPGRGKTGLSLAALRERVEREVRAGLYWDATALLTELIRGIRDHDGDAPDPVERAERVRYLLLDDIDKIAETPFKLQVIYDLVNKRHNNGLPTMFTANADLASLSKKLGAWSVDRIREMCGPEWVLELCGVNRRLAHVDGPDLRQSKNRGAA